jgi:predicted transcriptional regulator
MAVHDGAWIRRRSDQLVQLLLLLEEATLHELTSVEQIMVGSVIIAEPWQQLAHVRRTMLSNSFSFLPILMSRWYLLSDEAIVAITRMEANEERKSRLSLTVRGGSKTTQFTIDFATDTGAATRVELMYRKRLMIKGIDD